MSGGDAARPGYDEHQPVRVPIDDLTPGPTPRRQPLDEDHVQALAERLAELPPILVRRPTNAVIDGAHRIAAARLRGAADIAAVFFEGTDEEALVESIRRNVEHGKPLTLGERSRAALELLQVRSAWSDRRIAGVCGLSPKTIGRLRERATVETPQSRGRTGLDERARPTDPAAVRQLVADLLREHPQASLRVVAAAAGTSPSTVRDVRGRLGRGEDILPGRLRAATTRTAPAPLDLRDASLGAGPAGQALLEWMTRTDIHDNDWAEFVEEIPLSRLYGLVDEGRRRAEEWRRFAADLEARARREATPT